MTSNKLNDPWQPIPWTVDEVWAENHDTTTIRIKPLADQSFTVPKPGQFHMIYAWGIGEIPISFSSIAGNYVEHTIRRVGKVSAALTGLHAGSQVGIRGPYGSYWNVADCEKKDVIIVAGGVGLAPIKPLLEQLIQRPSDFRKIYVLYGARQPRDQLFINHYQTWSENLEFLQTVDIAVDGWQERVGVVTNLLDKIEMDPSHSICFVCGPEIMMHFTILKLLEIGLPPSAIRLSVERNMKCAIGFCGHCQFGSEFVCRNGPVFDYDRIQGLLKIQGV